MGREQKRQRGERERKEREGKRKEGREKEKGEGKKKKASQPTETSFFRGFPKIFPLGDIKLKLVWNLGPQQDSRDTLYTRLGMDISKSLHVSAVCFGEW